MKIKTKLRNMGVVGGVALAATLTTSWATAQPATEAHSTSTSKPNIVFILVDNVGLISPGTSTKESEVALLNHALNLHPDLVALQAY